MTSSNNSLFLAHTSQLPDEGCDDFIVVAAGIPDERDHEGVDELLEQGQLDFLLAFLCVAANRHEAESAVKRAWSDMVSSDLSLQLLSSDRRKLTRIARRIMRQLGDGGVARLGSAVGFKRGSSVARDDAESIVKLACLRRPWQFWR